MQIDLGKKVALITGGGKGLGLAQTKAFLNANAKVVITGRTQATLEEAKQALNHPDLHIYPHDISDKKSIPSLVAEITNKVGDIEYLVNNAGVHLKKAIWEVSDEEWDEVVAINLNGMFVMCREVIKPMKERQSGSIVNVSSMTGIMALPATVAYTTTKTARLLA